MAGLILLLDRLDEIDLDLGYGMPLLIAAVGAILLTAGLEGPAQALLTVPRLAGMSASAAAPLRRDPARGVLAGVAAGLARRLGIDPLIVRVGFIAASAAGGIGPGAVPARLGADARRGRASGRRSSGSPAGARPGSSSPG